MSFHNLYEASCQSSLSMILTLLTAPSLFTTTCIGSCPSPHFVLIPPSPHLPLFRAHLTNPHDIIYLQFNASRLVLLIMSELPPDVLAAMKVVTDLKAAKASKEDVLAAVEKLNALKLSHGLEVGQGRRR